MTTTLVADARAEALFVSDLQPSDHPTSDVVRATTEATLTAVGPDGCAAEVAHEYGEHPESCCARMRWARQAVDAAFAGS